MTYRTTDFRCCQETFVERNLETLGVSEKLRVFAAGLQIQPEQTGKFIFAKPKQKGATDKRRPFPILWRPSTRLS